MKKLIMLLFLSLMVAGCATTKAANPYPQLTSDNIQAVCETTETWQIRVMPMPVVVVRFGAGCGGVKDVLLFVTPVGDYQEVQRNLTVQLATTYYLEYLDREQPAGNNKKWAAKQIKKETTNEQVFFYYEVTAK